MKKIIALFCMILLVMITGCGKQQTEVNNIIKVGYIGPLTGDNAVLGEVTLNGITIAIDEINAAGGINGKQVEVIAEDGACNAKSGVLAIQKLINQDKVKIIMGAGCSSETLGAAPIAEENKIILISWGSSSPDITKSGDYIFRTWPSDLAQGKIIAEKAIADGKINVAIINANSDYNLGLAKAFTEYFTALGGKIAVQEIYEQDAKDFRTQLTKIKATNADALFIAPYLEGGLVIKQARELGITLPFYATDLVGSEDIIKEAAGAAEGVIYASGKFDEESVSVQEYYKKYQARFGKTPAYQAYSANSYDTAYVVAGALKEAGEDTEKLKAYFYNVKDYPGIAGTLTIDENGDALKEFQLMIIYNGAMIKLEDKPEQVLSRNVMVTQSDSSFEVTPTQVKSGSVKISIKNTDSIRVVTGIIGNGIDENYETPAKSTEEHRINLQPGTYELYDGIGTRKAQGRTANLEVLA